MAPITPNHVGAYFFREYYKVLLYEPHNIHHFYSDNSTMTRVDGISSQTASDKLQIDALLKSLNFAATEIKTVNSLYSLDGGVLVMASGLVKIKDLSERRKFVHCVFLAPQENGYFVLNDIFQFTDDGVIYPIEGLVASEKNDTQQPHASTTPAEAPALNHSLEEEASEYVKSTHIEDDPVDKHSLPKQQLQPLQQDLETGAVGQLEAPAEDASSSVLSTDTIHERHVALVEELLEEEPPQKTYASILQAPRPPTSQLNHVARHAAQQQSSASNIDPVSGFERAPTPPGFEEGGLYSSRRVTRPWNVRGKRH